ncbi:MAG: GlsB/YeaQ/YmgE family stress response membrane protein [Chloroflexota bacterium]
MGFIGDTIQFIITFPFIVVGWLIVGALAGDIARRIMGSANKGCLSDWVLGIVGSFVGGFVASLLGIGTPDGGLGLVFANLILAVVGAAIVVYIFHAVTGRPKAQAD